MIPPRAGRRNRLGRIALRVQDDEGSERDLADFVPGEVPDMSDPLARASLARLRSAVATLGRKGTRLALAAIVLTPLVLIQGLMWGHIYALKKLHVAPIWIALSLFGSVAACAFLLGWIIPQLQGRGLAGTTSHVVDAILRIGRCASCGHPLLRSEGEPPETVVRCSECGSAWRHGRIGPSPVPTSQRLGPAGARALIYTSAMARTKRRDDRGRPWAAESSMYLRRPKEVERKLRRITLPLLPFLVGAPLGGLGLLVLAASLAARTDNAWIVGGTILATALGAGLLVTAVIVRIDAVLRRRRLRVRTCLACEQRLRKEGDFLVCRLCGGAWRRPRR